MTLKDARNKLEKLEEFSHPFLLLNRALVHSERDLYMASDWMNTETTRNALMNETRSTSQICFPLMDGITRTNLYTTSTTGIGKKLTQRNTNLCVSFTAPRLLSYALVNFLESYCNVNPIAFEHLKNSILNISNVFIEELITICCAVISPRSLAGLNHCNVDDNFQISVQEQNIRE